VRLFVALNLPDSVRQALWRAAGPLRELGLPVRWVRPEGLHLTLKFLGEVAPEREAELAAALGRAATGSPASPGSPGVRPGSRGLHLALRGCGAFPDVKRPRVLWVGIEPEPALELLQHRVEQEFAPLGFPTEARPFRPHLTLGRAERDARVQGFRPLAGAIEKVAFDETATVETLDLMESQLQRNGAVYHARHRERLS
jgi:2'-5' RNA ligase